MMNPVQTTVPQPDGSDRQVIIEPVIEKNSEGRYGSTGVFKIYKDAFGDETHLFTEPAEFGGEDNELPDEQNPDYLGKFIFDQDGLKHFDGQVLSLAE